VTTGFRTLIYNVTNGALAPRFALRYCNSMRILIASGIFAPEAGGPATYAPRLATELSALGHTVSVLTFSARPEYDGDAQYPFSLHRVVRRGRLGNRVRFFFAAFRLARDADIVYTLDWFAVGLPLALAARLHGVPYVVRVGGDYLWEQRYLESGEPPITLKEFYERGLHRRVSYRPFLWVISFVLKCAAHVVFNSIDQRELYQRHYGLARTSTIENPVPRIEGVERERTTSEFVYFGRFIVMKNLETLLRAFAAAKLPREFTLTLIGDGPQKRHLETLAAQLGCTARVHFEPSLPQRAVLERVKDARAFILPSWTDIAPNQVYEALALGLPALVTRETYLSIRDHLPETFDPHSVAELAAKLELLADDARYAAFSRSFGAITFAHDWKAVAREHLDIFCEVLGRNDEPLRVLQIGADRSKRGILYRDSPATARQRAYAARFGQLDIIGFSRRSDGARTFAEPHLSVFPTNSRSPLLYGLDALRIAGKMPRPDVVSAQDPFETGFVAWLIARRFRAPLHVQVHTDFLSPEYARLSYVNRVRVLIARFVLRRAARIRVVSERIATSLTMLDFGVPITVLPIFVDLDKLRNASVEPEPAGKFSAFRTKVLIVSRLEREKNVALAVSAFAAAPKDACLIIVGDGSQRAALGRLAAERGIAERVFFEGLQDAARYYPLVDLVLVTSRYEGYGLVIVEALAAGKPVLSTDVGVAKEAGAIVTTPEHFAPALKQWFESGPCTGELKGYPYKNFEEYVAAYCDDIAACTKHEKSL
jgi:glycosyltransferase involved in cell wall biosynthesis